MNALDMWSDLVVQRLGWTLIHSLWQGVLIAAALAGVLRLLRSAPANLRYLTSCVAIGMLVVSAGVTFTQVKVAESRANPEPIVSQAAGFTEQTTAPPLALMVTPIPAAPLHPAPPPTDERLRWVVLAWAVGVAGLSLWHIGGWLWLTQMRRGQRLDHWEPSLHRLMERLGIRRAV